VSAALKLRIPARPEYLVLGRLVLTGISRTRPIDPDTLSDLKLALTEACSNSMRHAYDGTGGAVEIRFEVDETFLAVEVLDDGPGFERVDGDADDSDELDEGGLGLAIIEAVSDVTEYGRRPDGPGSRVRFVKLLEAT
jgi:serine/threonine-protein kinase RsbW